MSIEAPEGLNESAVADASALSEAEIRNSKTAPIIYAFSAKSEFFDLGFREHFDNIPSKCSGSLDWNSSDDALSRIAAATCERCSGDRRLPANCALPSTSLILLQGLLPAR